MYPDKQFTGQEILYILYMSHDGYLNIRLYCTFSRSCFSGCSSQGFSWSPSNRYLNRSKLASTRLCNNHIMLDPGKYISPERVQSKAPPRPAQRGTDPASVSRLRTHSTPIPAIYVNRLLIDGYHATEEWTSLGNLELCSRKTAKCLSYKMQPATYAPCISSKFAACDIGKSGDRATAKFI